MFYYYFYFHSILLIPIPDFWLISSIMATATSTPPQFPYARRVSFNNLQPDDLEAGGPPDLSRFQTYAMAPKKNIPKSQDPELSKLFINYSFSSPATSSSRKKLKLPQPPAKLILKNKLSADQLRLNVAHAIKTDASFAKELNDLVDHPPDSVPRLELAKIIRDGETPKYLENALVDSDDELPPSTPAPPEGRRKLYSGMTNEELMALDPQFSKPSTSDLKDFNFCPLGSSYSSQRKNSAPNIFVSPPAKGKQVLYPSSNENNYKSVALTVKHRDFDRADRFPRTILTVISGRRHTWNAIDWLLLTDQLLRNQPEFLQNGDHLVVAALVPLKFMQTGNKGSGSKKDSGERKVQQKCEDILNYILKNLPDPNVPLKITVELVIDVEYSAPMSLSASPLKKGPTGTKFMMAHLFKQYQPTLVVVGNKSTSLNFKYPRRMSRGTSTTSTPRSSSIGTVSTPAMKPVETEIEQYLVKLSSYLIRYSTVPVVVAGNSTIFHRKPTPKVIPSVTFQGVENTLKSILDPPPNAARHNSYSSDGSIESFCGEQPRSYDLDSLSMDELLESSTEPDLPIDPFASMILGISLKSLADLKNYLEQLKADKIPAHFADSKVHQAYVSMEQGRQGSILKTNSTGTGGRAYKVKSLISYNEEDEKKNERLISDKKLKKSISRNSVVSSVLGGGDEKTKKKKKSFLQRIGLRKS